MDTVVLPPGNWDKNVLLPILIAQSRAIALRRKMAKAGKNGNCYMWSCILYIELKAVMIHKHTKKSRLIAHSMLSNL